MKRIIEVTDQELKDLKLIRNYFGEHDKTSFEHFSYNELDKIFNKLNKSDDANNFISGINNLTDDIIKYFPKFFDDFSDFEYGTGINAGKDFKKIFNKAKKLKKTVTCLLNPKPSVK